MDAPRCPRCQQPLAANSPAGLCACCLLGVLLEGPSPGPVPHAVPAPSAGTLWGDYELLGEIARGGMGVVYRARQRQLNRVVALKVVLAPHLAGEVAARRFRHEARAAASLDHPNIVPILHVGEHDGRPFYTMKLVDGGTLAQQLVAEARRRQDSSAPAASPPPDPRPSALVVAKLARAVHFAHRRGILHRDLKPANILLDAAGEPHVADFGLATQLADSDPDEGHRDLTLTGAVVGTPSYLPPEQARGERPLTTAADIYSLGAILFELLAGRPPFEAENTPALLRKIVEDEPPVELLKSRLAGCGAIGRDLITITRKALAKEPTRRFATAADLAEDLERVVRGEPIVARSAGPGEQVLRWARRKPAWAIVALLVIAAPLAVIATLLAGNVRVRRAEAGTRSNLYAADMQVAQTALEDANLALAQRILGAHRPKPGEPDLRGFEWRYLWHKARSGELRVLRAHSRSIRSLAFSPDGRWLASLEAGPVTWFWNTTTWRNERVVDWSGADPVEFSGLAFSSDRATVAISSTSGAIILFAPTNQISLKPRYLLQGRPPAVLGRSAAVWSPDARWIAFLADDGSGNRFTAVLDWSALQKSTPPWRPLKVGDVLATGILPFLGHPSPPVKRLSPVDQLHSVTRDGLVLARRGDELVGLNVDEGGAPAVIASGHQFDYCERSPDGRFLAGFNSRPKDRHSILVDEYQRGRTNYWEIIGHGGDIRCLAISPDGRRILSGSADHTARIWDSGDRSQLAVLRGHTDEVTAVAWSPDGQIIATGSRDHTVMLWSAAATNRPADKPVVIGSSFAPCRLSPDGSALVASVETPVIGGVNRLRVQPLNGAPGIDVEAEMPLVPVQLADGGRSLLGVSELPGGRLELRRWEEGSAPGTSLKRAFDLPAEAAVGVAGIRWALSADSRWLARGDARGTVLLWETEGRNTSPLASSRRGASVTALEFSPRLALLAVAWSEGDIAGEISVFRPGVSTPERRTAKVESGIKTLAWSPDEAMLAVGGEDHALRILDTSTLRLLRTLSGHKQGVAAVAFTPDGRTLASGDTRTIKLWHTATGREMLTIFSDVQFAEPLGWLAFTADGTRLLAGDTAGRVQVFTAPSVDETDHGR